MCAVVIAGPSRGDEPAAAPLAASFSYLYIDANEDRASGGHAAVRLRDDVFHFQYDRGLMRLEWDDWRDFNLDYRGFQNRNLRESRVSVSADTEARLHSVFRRRHLSRTNQIELLADARADRDLALALLDPQLGALPLPGLGLFASDPDRRATSPSRLVRDLRAAVAADLDEGSRQPKVARAGTRDPLGLRREAIELALAELPVAAMEISAADFERAAFPRPRYPFHERYADLVAARRALEVLNEPASLRADALASGASSGWIRGASLTPEERIRLEETTAIVSARLVALARGTRPDWGRALLLGMARLAAIEASLERGEWLLLDTLGADSERLAITERRRALLPTLVAEARRDWEVARAGFLAAGAFDELAYTSLEDSQSRWIELRRAVAGANEIRIVRRRQVPMGIGLLTLPDVPRALVRNGAGRLAALERTVVDAEREATASLGYRLASRNCVSELFALVSDAMAHALRDRGVAPTQAAIANESTTRLGGHVAASSLPDVIPFMSSRRVRRHWRVDETRELLSSRRLKARQLREAATTPWVAVRESNTLTSTLYTPGDNDSFFVFFTDDSVATRPVLGAFNFGAAIAGAGTGVLWLPFDRGRLLGASLRGAFFSLPELAFFNIRKGTNEWALRSSIPPS
jgi:hypothetical protein